MGSFINWTGKHAPDVLKLKNEAADIEPPSTHMFILPREVLIEIFLELDWPDILRARRTCAELYSTSKERPIWLKLLREALPASAKLDYPIELYSDSELENFTLRILAAYNGWKNSSPPSARRKITYEDGIVHFYLSDSGRWLFLFTLHGAVVYHDLDNPDIPARLLIYWVASPYPLRLEFAVDVDEKVPTLTFNLALYLDRRGEFPQFQIWRVRLHTQSQPFTGYFTAEKLASFARDSYGSLLSISLQDHHIAYAVRAPNRPSAPYIAIINWVKIGLNLKPHDLRYRKRVIFPFRAPKQNRIRFHLLPRHQLFVITGKVAVLYEYLKEKEIRDVLPVLYEGHTFFSEGHAFFCESDLILETLSKPFICPASNTIRLIACCCATYNIADLSILGFIMPLEQPVTSDQNDNESVTLRSVLLTQEHNLPASALRELDSFNVCFGYNKGIVRAQKPRIVALTYSWPDEAASVSPGDVYKHVYERVDTLPPALNELTGRVVEYTSAGHLDVYEFSPFIRRTRH